MTLTQALEIQRKRKINMLRSMIEHNLPDGYTALVNDLLSAAMMGKEKRMNGRDFQINEDGSLTERQ